jgi:hypothetical protein
LYTIPTAIAGPPAIPLVPGKGLSQGGFVILTDDPKHQYQLFSNPGITDITKKGELAGCGSGTCLKVTPRPAPAPLPILGAAAAFGASRKLRRRMKVIKVVASTATVV